MGKIGLVAAKYIVHSNITIEGTVDRPDVIGAVFGQTEGLLGEDLELRELQRNGKIGRIEVNLTTKSGKASGEIIIPSSLDKAETAIIAAALETIQRIGPCNAKVVSKNIEDVRTSKRAYVVDRAKELLREFTDNVLPDSQEITEEVSHSVRMMELIEYGKDRLAAGPIIEESDEIIVVEGRADVLTLLKNGIKNPIALNGTSVPQTIIDLSKRKEVTVFVDGDRGGDLIIKEIMSVAEIDYIVKAPDGKEVEELTKKEINKALRNKVAAEQSKLEITRSTTTAKTSERRTTAPRTAARTTRTTTATKYKTETSARPPIRKARITPTETKLYKEMIDDLVGTRGAYILDEDTNILGKVPTSELATTIKSLKSGINTVIFDGEIDIDLVKLSERVGIKNLVAMSSKVQRSMKVKIITKADL
ncbi:DNA primase [Candidatus Woesearchaeota archaeon]|jgi:DNA primase|nr:DNA primase [Candidatus Woesearchaeota archaeon]MBT4321815.1 DNA primase [Candidatus Woesearchaeota archaeon]